MPAYLFDTNHISEWERRNTVLMNRLRREPVENFVFVCPIALSEIEHGLRNSLTPDLAQQRACREFIAREATEHVVDIGPSIQTSYAAVLGTILTKYPMPTTGHSTTQKHLTDIRVDVNDIWIASVALEHDFILLTNDKMEVIKECATGILRFDNWLV